MDSKCFSNQGRRLKLYKLRGNDYFAIDNDVANFFGIEKKYLLKADTQNKAIYGKKDKIALTNKELKSTPEAKIANSKGKVFAFSMSGIPSFPFDIKKNEFTRKMSSDIVKETANNITKMTRVMRVAKKLKDQKKFLTQCIVALEICKREITKKNTEEYDKYQERINKLLSDAHGIHKTIEYDSITANKMMREFPRGFRNILLSDSPALPLKKGD